MVWLFKRGRQSGQRFQNHPFWVSSRSFSEVCICLFCVYVVFVVVVWLKKIELFLKHTGC